MVLLPQMLRRWCCLGMPLRVEKTLSHSVSNVTARQKHIFLAVLKLPLPQKNYQALVLVSIYSVEHIILSVSNEVSIYNKIILTLGEPLKVVHAHEHFNTTLGNSYRCVRLQHFNLTKETDDKTLAGVAKVTDLRFQAFENKNKGGFGLGKFI